MKHVLSTHIVESPPPCSKKGENKGGGLVVLRDFRISVKEGCLRAAAEDCKKMYFTVHFIWTVLEAQKELEALLEICFSYGCLF